MYVVVEQLQYYKTSLYNVYTLLYVYSVQCTVYIQLILLSDLLVNNIHVRVPW